MNNTTSSQLEQAQRRIDNLESQLAFQDDTLAQLNDALSQQQLQLNTMNQQIRLMADKLKQVQPNQLASQSEETPPPHY